MEAVRGVIDANGSAGRGGAFGCRGPHLAQKTSAASTWFPHGLKKGTLNLMLYAKAECTGKPVARKQLQPRHGSAGFPAVSAGPLSLRRERHGCGVVLPLQLQLAGISPAARKRHVVNLHQRRRLAH